MTNGARPNTAALLALLLSAGCGCSEDGDGAPSSGGTAGSAGVGGGTGGTAWGTGGTGAAGGSSSGGVGNSGGCGPQPLPKEVPAGWEEYTGYSCGCRFYVPGPTAAPLDPVEWEACPQPGPIGVSCQRMKTPWTTGSAIRVAPRYWYDSTTDRSYLQFARLRVADATNTVRHSLVAEADGAIKSALLEVGLGCTLVEAGVQGGKYVFGARGQSNGGEITGQEGFTGGSVGQAPTVGHNYALEQYDQSSWRMTSEWIIRWKNGLFGRRFDAPDEEVTIFSPGKDVEGLPPYNVQGVGESVLFRVGSGVTSGVMAWTQSGGVVPVVRYVGDANRAAGNFGTDGVDMVWTYGEGTYDQGKFTTQSVMTAPFSLDTATVEKTVRRLRSDPGVQSALGFAVGSGYAARRIDDVSSGVENASADLLVVRLVDGVSWQVKMPAATEGPAFMTALGFSKDEVFATAQFKDASTAIVRIRLDSLGPGTPPD
ncbi:MAG: hypothetical protein R3B13_27220 [Polyangiaceae bacterium]